MCGKEGLRKRLIKQVSSNKSVDIAGIKLLMPLEEVTAKMNGEGIFTLT